LNVIEDGLLLKSSTSRAVGDLARLGWTTPGRTLTSQHIDTLSN